jgi:tetratricopeptide (TPR) repeat protein
MALRPTIQFSLLYCLLAGVGSCLFAQDTHATKEAPPAGTAYSTEESETVTARLAQRESDLRADLARQPESADLLYALALVLQQEGKARESLDTYTRAARSRNPAPEELRSVALNYVLLNDFEDAIHWLEVAAQMAPRDANILYALGRCYYSKDRFLDAGKMYERVLAIQPQHLKAEENLGLVYDATNRADLAEDAFRRAAGWAIKNGTDEWPFLDLGSFLLDQDRPKEAIDPLRDAVRIRPECAACHEKLGRALLATHDSLGALAELEQATKLDPKSPKTHYELGRALRQAGQAERAQQEFILSQKLYTAHSQE